MFEKFNSSINAFMASQAENEKSYWKRFTKIHLINSMIKITQ